MEMNGRMLLPGVVAALTVGLAACGGDTGGLRGSVEIDGSSTVFPITEAVAEEFMMNVSRAVRVNVGFSGTGGGFKRFCAGETAVSDASRPIKDSERALCAENGVEFIDFTVSYDGISLVVNPDNTWVECLTVDELRRIWEPGSEVGNWSQVRDGFPDERILLYGPGTDSGTFDYFTEAIMGEEDASRSDYTASEDDNVLVQGVAGDAGALGYFGFAYYEENTERLGLLAVDNGAGCVAPSRETIRTNEYAPLSRPMFIYVNTAALQDDHVEAFVRYYMENAAELVPQVGYVPLDPADYEANLARVANAVGG